jgi:carbonic anhydrase
MKTLAVLFASTWFVVGSGISLATDVTADAGEGTGYKPEQGKWFEEYQEYWKHLKGSNQDPCTNGRMQSPINVPTNLGSAPSNERIAFGGDDRGWQIKVGKSDHTAQFDVTSGAQLSIGGQGYKFLQFHFHHPSEHLLDGQRFPMEMHLVHGDAAGNPKAVVAVLIGISPKPPVPMADSVKLPAGFDDLKTFFRKPRPDVGTPAGSFSGRNNLYSVLVPQHTWAAGRTYSTYDGSLTTPGCSGNLKWFVMHTPAYVTETFIKNFKDVYDMNARWPQTLDARVIKTGASTRWGAAFPTGRPGGR